MNGISQYFRSLSEYPRAFWVMCLHMLLFMFSFNMLLPELNEYITGLGGADDKWLIVGLWTVAAAISRPLSGKIADNISRKSVMYFGVVLSILISFMYPFFITVTGFLFLRFLHGFSTGFQPTGATAFLADVIPQGRRGEAMGIFGVTFTIGMSVGMGMASTVKDLFGMDGLFYACGIVGLSSLILLFFMKEDKTYVENNVKEQGYTSLWDKMIPKWTEVFGKEVLQPSFVMFMTASAAGVYFLTIPDLSVELGYTNKGIFWLMYAGFTIVTRLVAGKLADRYGARNNLLVCCVVLIIATILTGTSTTTFQFSMSAILYGIGSGIGSPALFAWTADLSNPLYKGRGMGTLFIALELGILNGNYFAQVFYNNNPENFDIAFGFAAVLCFIALIFLILTKKFAPTPI